MASAETVSLSREEVRQIVDVLADAGGDAPTGMNQEDRQRYFQLLVKLDKALGKDARWWGVLSELPDWIREILHRTFTPQPVKPRAKGKTPTPAAAAGAHHAPATPADAAAARRREIARKGGLARAAKAAAQQAQPSSG